jgi:hypothetical protein
MRRRTRALLCIVLSAASLAPAPGRPPAQAQGAPPPNAWLYGSWTGGLFPAPTALSAETCLAQPAVIFTRDLVLRASLTEDTYTQRVIAAVQATRDGVAFRFEPSGGGAATTGAGLLGLPAPAQAAGFGCASPDLLVVRRLGENEIAFPDCSDFPNPLVRCPTQ